MDDKSESLHSARFWALMLLLPALGSFLGMLAEIYLNIRWLAFASDIKESVWIHMVAPTVMGGLMALLIVVVQMAIVGKFYRIDISIDIFPIFGRSSARGSPWILVANAAAFAGVVAASNWVAPLMVAGTTYGVGPNTFMAGVFISQILLVAPMIVLCERARAVGKAD